MGLKIFKRYLKKRSAVFSFEFKKAACEKSFIKWQIHLSVEVGIDLCKRRNTTLTILIDIYWSRDASEFPEKDSSYYRSNRLQEKRRKTECVENVASCVFDTILYYWYESCVFYKELNNLLLSVTSVCPRPGQKKKKAPHCVCLFFILEILHIWVSYFGPRWKTCLVLSWKGIRTSALLGPRNFQISWWGSC